MSSKPDTFDPYGGCDVLRQVVERAIEPYRDLPPEELEELRDFLIVHTTTHPVTAPLYARVRRRKPAGKSGVATADLAGDALSQAAEGAARGARVVALGSRRGGRS